MSRPTRADDRAISEILGTVLLISLVLVGSATVIVLGAGAISEAHESTRTQAAGAHLQELDAQLSTLSAADDQPETSFEPDDALATEYRIERDGYINVTVNPTQPNSCSFEQNFSTIVYEDSQGRTVGYEAGGVWRGQRGGSSALTPPDVTFVNGRLGVEVVNLTGHVDQAINVARLNRTATQNRTRVAADALRQGDCVRPDNITIRVNSRFQRGWSNYLASETGADASDVDTFPNGSVKVTIRQDSLHPSVNDSENNVINLGGAPYMDSVTLDNSSAPPTVGVDKGVNNTYSVFVEPLSEDQLGFGQERQVVDVAGTRPPIDVSIVLDESGSMGGGPMDAAKGAAQNFTSFYNESKDRISIQTYNASSYYRPVNGIHFSSEFGGVNNPINDTIENDFSDGGNTRIDRGLSASVAAHDFKSSENRQKFTVLLTDGLNNNCFSWQSTYDCDDNVRTLEAAWRADNNSVTVFTIGFGSDVNDELLEDVAEATGGEYFPVDNAENLNDAFREIGGTTTEMNVTAATPLTSSVSPNGTNTTYDADIPGDTSQIAQVSTTDGTFLNVNDPTAPTLFSHSFAMKDGDTAELNVTRYDCEEDAWNLTGASVSGSGNRVARCTDIGSANGTFNASIYVDGESPETLLETTYEPWQDDVNESLDAFPSVNINSTTGNLEAKSNQALVVFDLPPRGDGSINTLTLVVQIGIAESEGRGIVDVHVAEAELSNS